MINRRHLRIKVMQILYSQYAANSKPKELLKILEERSLKFYLFFITYLLLFRDLKREFTEKEKIVSNKNFVQPSRYVFSKDLSLDWTAPFFHLPGKKVVVTAKKKLPKFSRDLKDISILNCRSNRNQLDPVDFIKRLSKENINNILIESGPALLGSFGDENLIDEYIFYLSPEKLGDKASHFYGGQNKINFFESKQFDIVDEINIGKDKKVILRKK